MKSWKKWIRKWNPLVLSNRAVFGKGISLMKRFWLLLLAAFVVLGTLSGMFLFYYFSWALSFDLSQVEVMPETTIVYDRNGYIVQRFYEQNRMFAKSEQIPEVMKQAVIATEDKRFYHHFGFDPISMTRAFIQNLAGARTVSGASTITQQLARNSADMFERTFDRKLKEIFLAMRLEMIYNKDQILTLYLNRIYFGKQNYGLAAATDAYFGKEPKDLTLSESAMLAGIISGPNSFSPWSNTAKSKAVRAKSLDRMVEAGYITEAQSKKAEDEPLVLRPLINLPGSYAVSAVRDELPSFLSHEDLVNGGLRIYTTLDVSFQRAAEEQLELTLSEIEVMPGYKHPTRKKYIAADNDDEKPKYLQGSFVAINNKDGGILALVGGRKYEESTFNRATLGARQVGSTLKPFVYANAFNVLNTSGFTLVDESAFDLTKGEASGAIPTGPAPDFNTIRHALEVSNNYAAMRTGMLGGVENFAYLVKQATTQDIPAFASSTLGACSVTPLQMASAYSVFPNQGVRIQPYLVESITNKDGTKVLYSHKDTRYRVLSPEIAFQVHSLLMGVVDNGTGRSLRSTFGLLGEVAGKTGTTNDFKDSWFMGYTQSVTAGVWIGLDEPETILNGGFASRLAVPAWGRVMKMAEAHYPAPPLVPPAGLQLVQQQQGGGFLSSPAPAGPAEYLRPDQIQNGYLARLDGSGEPGTGTALAGPPKPASKEWWKFWESDAPANHAGNGANLDQDDDGNVPAPNKKLRSPKDRR